MMFIEESVLDNNIKNIIKNSNGITNTDRATGKLLEATTVRPFVSLDAAQEKDAKFSNFNLPANPKLLEFDLESFHENLKRVKDILFKNNQKTTGGGDNCGQVAAGVETVEKSASTPAASASAVAISSPSSSTTAANANAYATSNGNGNVKANATGDKETIANGFSNSESKKIKTNKLINKETLLEFKQRIKTKLSKDKEKLEENKLETKQALAPLPALSASASDEKNLKKSEENLEDFTLIDILDEEEQHSKDDQIDIETPLVINYNIEENLEEEEPVFKHPHHQDHLKDSIEEDHPIEIVLEQSSYEEQFLPENSNKNSDNCFRKNFFSHIYDLARRSPSPVKTIAYKLEDLLGYNQEADPNPRLLNGSFDLQNKTYHQGLSSSYCEDHEEDKSPHHFYKNRYSCPQRLITEEPPRKSNNTFVNQDSCPEHSKENILRTDKLLVELCREYQMGFEFLSRLRRYIFPQSDDKRIQEGSRKRRAEDVPPENNNPNLIKYRKVENNFPRIITQTFEDDMNPQRNQTVCQSHNMFQNNNTDVSKERRSFQEKGRNSLFSLPKKTQKILRPGSFAQLEFSDDDDDNDLRNTDRAFNTGSLITSARGLNGEGFKKPTTRPPAVVQVPIKRTNEDRNQLFKSTSVFKSSGGCSTSGILGSSKPVASISMEANSVARRPCYADVLKYGKLGNPSIQQLIDRSNNQSVSKPSSSKNLNTSKPKTSSYLANKGRSVLQHQREIEEREKYNKLLQTVAPHLYAKENRFQTSSRRSSLAAASPKGRRSLTTYVKPSAIINLDDDDDASHPSGNQPSTLLSSTLNKSRQTSKVINLDPEDSDSSEVTEVVNLDDDVSVSSSIIHLRKHFNDEKPFKEPKKKDLPFVEPVNSLKDCFQTSPHLDENWLDKFKNRWESSRERRLKELLETTKENEQITAERKAAEVKLHEKFREFHIVDPDLIIVDDFAEAEEEPEITSLTAEQDEKVKAAIYGPPDQVLVSKFNMNITRRDIHTLLNQNWLNDEVINFYMNLLMERGDLKHESHNYPTVYAMNTFFVPRLLQSGHSGVRRWTRKINIFSKDVVPVPVHVGGVHWCMAIIHLKNRSIKYYDSMGTPNPTVLKALEKYLQDESMDKRKQPFDTSDFVIESVRDVPRQMNGSDCGVFSCMFAEYITRNKGITFSQNEMVYFRNKMILEIVQGELLR